MQMKHPDLLFFTLYQSGSDRQPFSLFRLQGFPDFPHRLAFESPMVRYLIPRQEFFDIEQHLFHLHLVHSIQALQDCQFG
jgi:hypothetical protein